MRRSILCHDKVFLIVRIKIATDKQIKDHDVSSQNNIVLTEWNSQTFAFFFKFHNQIFHNAHTLKQRSNQTTH